MYAWIIDTNHLSVPGDLDSEEGTVGPRDAPAHLVAMLEDPANGATFSMSDDDGELYYTGRLVSDEPLTGPNCMVEGDEPLADYGTPNAGATEIRWTAYPELNCG